jgi:nucleoside-diphosphate-sugar epimerase
MRVAITGVSGFIGSRIAALAYQRGHQVVGLVRPTSRRDHVERQVERFVIGDQADESAWRDLLDGADCIIHNSVDWTPLRSGDLRGHLRSNLESSIGMIEAAHAGGRNVHFMFISSVSVHHDIAPRWKGVIDEDHPLRPGSWYGAYKAAVEDHLWAAAAVFGLPFTIFRPCAVYGIDPRLERSIAFPFIEQLRATKRFDRPGGGKFVHVDDVAGAIVAAIGNKHARNGAFNLADCYARWADLASMLAQIMGIDSSIDFSSPPRSHNVFSKDAVRQLGAPLDRGHDGLREYLCDLVRVVESHATAS